MKERLQKLLAQASAATSRRAAELLIEQGRVRINGDIAHLGDKADPATDVITIDGSRLKLEPVKKIYIALNKPKHVLTTTEPHKGDERRTVYDLVKAKENLFSIGRLDADSEGLVVLTNDGDLAQRLSHPRYRHSKTYKVEVAGLPGQDVLDKWRNGVILEEDERTAPCVVMLLEGDKRISTLRIIMTEGKKRQIRRVGMKLGHQVKRLVRTHIGMLPLGELRTGEWRELSPADVKLLKTPAPELRLLKGVRRGNAKDRRQAVKAQRVREGEAGNKVTKVRSEGIRDEAEQPARRSSLSRLKAPRGESGQDDGRKIARSKRDRFGGESERPARRPRPFGAPPARSEGSEDEGRKGTRSTQNESRDESTRPVRKPRPTGARLPHTEQDDTNVQTGTHTPTDRPRRSTNKGGKPAAGRPGSSSGRAPRGESSKPSSDRSKTPSHRRNSSKKDRP